VCQFLDAEAPTTSTSPDGGGALRGRIDRANESGLPWAAICLLGLGIAAGNGCKQGPYRELYTAQMGNEIRVLEDQLYECDFENRRLHQELERLRMERQRFDKEMEELRRQRGGGAGVFRRGLQRPITPQAAEEDVSPGAPEPPRLDPADLHPPPPPPVIPSPPSEAVIEDGQVKQTHVEVPGLPLPRLITLSGKPAEQLLIEPARSSGWDFDLQGGDDGIRISLSARDGEGQPTQMPEDGVLELAVFDAECEDPDASQSLAIQSFTAEELRKQPWTADGVSVELKVPFDQAVPAGTSVTVIVRFRRGDDFSFVAEHTIRLRTEEEVASGWIAR